MFKSLLRLTKNVVDVVTAPVELVVDVANAVVEPIAEVTQDVVEAVKDELGQSDKDNG